MAGRQTVKQPEGGKRTPRPASAHHSMAIRRGEPLQRYTVADARGVESSVDSDEEGVVRPLNTEQVRVADAFALPYWREPIETPALEEPEEDDE